MNLPHAKVATRCAARRAPACPPAALQGSGDESAFYAPFVLTKGQHRLLRRRLRHVLVRRWPDRARFSPTFPLVAASRTVSPLASKAWARASLSEVTTGLRPP